MCYAYRCSALIYSQKISPTLLEGVDPAKGEKTMEDLWEHAAMRWFLAIIVFVATFHATWTALEYRARVAKPTPSVEKPEFPTQGSPGFLVEDRSSISLAS